MTLKHSEMLQLINFPDGNGDQVFSWFCLCGWKGLMRMQSECFGLEVGEASEVLQYQKTVTVPCSTMRPEDW